MGGPFIVVGSSNGDADADDMVADDSVAIGASLESQVLLLLAAVQDKAI